MTTGTDAYPQRRTVRLTGFAYLATAITGALSYLILGPQLRVAGDASATMESLIDKESLARAVLVVDLALMTSGLMLTLLFFALFRKVDLTLSVALAAFNFMGGVAIAIGSIFRAQALQVAVGADGRYEDAPNLVLLLSEMYETAWSIGALFFGLWLIPMGLLVLRSGWMPRPLGWVLVVGGVGYIASCVLDQLRPEASTLVEILTVPANIGEFSMMVFLLIRGISSKPIAAGRIAEANTKAP